MNFSSPHVQHYQHQHQHRHQQHATTSYDHGHPQQGHGYEQLRSEVADMDMPSLPHSSILSSFSQPLLATAEDGFDALARTTSTSSNPNSNANAGPTADADGATTATSSFTNHNNSNVAGRTKSRTFSLHEVSDFSDGSASPISMSTPTHTSTHTKAKKTKANSTSRNRSRSNSRSSHSQQRHGRRKAASRDSSAASSSLPPSKETNDDTDPNVNTDVDDCGFKRTNRRTGPYTHKGFKRHYATHNYHDYSYITPQQAMASLSLPNSKTANRNKGGKGNNSNNSSSNMSASTIRQHLQLQLPTTVRGGVQTPFPFILHQMLEDASKRGHEVIVSWQPHGRAFLIHNPKQFAVTVLPTYFKHSKMSSFQRQLSLYGFTRLTSNTTPDRGGYYHELFLRGRTFLCAYLQRTRIKGTWIRKSSSPQSEPDFYTMEPVPDLVPASPIGAGDVDEDMNNDTVSARMRHTRRHSENTSSTTDVSVASAGAHISRQHRRRSTGVVPNSTSMSTMSMPTPSPLRMPMSMAMPTSTLTFTGVSAGANATAATTTATTTNGNRKDSTEDTQETSLADSLKSLSSAYMAELSKARSAAMSMVTSTSGSRPRSMSVPTSMTVSSPASASAPASLDTDHHMCAGDAVGVHLHQSTRNKSVSKIGEYSTTKHTMLQPSNPYEYQYQYKGMPLQMMPALHSLTPPQTLSNANVKMSEFSIDTATCAGSIVMHNRNKHAQHTSSQYEAQPHDSSNQSTDHTANHSGVRSAAATANHSDTNANTTTNANNSSSNNNNNDQLCDAIDHVLEAMETLEDMGDNDGNGDHSGTHIDQHDRRVQATGASMEGGIVKSGSFMSYGAESGLDTSFGESLDFDPIVFSV